MKSDFLLLAKTYQKIGQLYKLFFKTLMIKLAEYGYQLKSLLQ